MSALKISHINTFPYGGAATAALRTHGNLRERGVDSRFFYSRDERNGVWPQAVEQIELAPAKQGFIAGLFQKKARRTRQKEIYRLFNTHISDRDAAEETFSMARLPEPGGLPAKVTNCDVVHLHWISFLADYPSFFESIPRSVPIVWTLHDMNPFTGGCHYSAGCEKFTNGCGTCPQVISPSATDVSTDSMAAKTAALAGRSIHVTAPSQWMLDLAQRSPVWPAGTTFKKIHLRI